MLLKNLSLYQKMSLLLAFISLLTVLLFLLFWPQRQPNLKPTEPPAKLSLLTSDSHLTLNQEFVVPIVVTDLSQTINTITANLFYPAELLAVSKIDSVDSPFEVWFEKQILPEQNLIRLTASAKPPGVNRDSIFAKVIFKAKAQGSGEVRFEETSKVFRYKDAINILGETRSLPFWIQ